MSAYYGHIEVCELLVFCSADVNARNKLYCIPSSARISEIDLLIFCSVSESTPLHASAVNGHVEVCKLLISAKADAAARNR